MERTKWIVALILCLFMLTVSGCASWAPRAANSNGMRSDAAQKEEITLYSFDRRNYEQPDRVLARIEQETNVKLRILTGPWDDTQLDVLVATGDYPDVITIVDSEKSGRFNKWVKEGVLVPFDAALLEGLPHLQKLFSQPGFQNLKINGQFYGLPLKDEFPPGSADQHVIVMRKDWLDRLQLPVPENLEQFRQTLVAFKNGDPDGNQVKDTYGLVSDGLYSIVRNLVGAWGLPIDERSTGFLQVGGDYEYWAIQPQVREALRYVRGLYRDNLIQPDTLSLSTNVQVRPKFVEGRVGAMFDHVNFEELVKKEDQLKRHTPDARLMELSALEGPTGQRGYSIGSEFWGYTVITNKAKDPKAIARLFDFLLSDEGSRLTLFGVPDVHYSVDNGRYTLYPEERKKDVGFDPNHPGAPHELSWGIVQWSQMTDSTYLQLRDLTRPDFSKVVFDNLERVNKYLIEPAAIQLATPKWISFKANSDQLYQEYFNKIVMGELDVDEGFARFVEKWKESGGSEAMKEMSDAIKASK